jgi:hypothetical protein
MLTKQKQEIAALWLLVPGAGGAGSSRCRQNFPLKYKISENKANKT